MANNDDPTKQAREEAIRRSREAVAAARNARNAPPRAGNAPQSDDPAPGGTQRPSGPVATSGELSDAPAGFDALEMLSNAPGSFATNVKSVVWDLPKAVIQSAIHYAKNPSKYVEDFKLLMNRPGDVWKVFKDDYVDYYGEGDFGREVSEDPFRFVSDVAGAAALGGGTAAKAATVAARGSRVANPALARAAAGVGRAARTVAAVEKYDPVSLTMRGASKVFRPVADAMGIGELTPLLRSLDSTIVGAGEREGAEASIKLYSEGMTPEMNDQLLRALTMGETDHLTKLQAANPELFQRVKTIKETIEADSAKFLDETGAVSKVDQESALIKQYIRYKKQLDKVDVSYDDAKKLYDAKAIQPTYLSIHGPGRANDFFSAVNDPLYHAGTLSRAMQRAMKGEVPTDLHGILSHQLRASIGARENIKLTRAAMEMMHQKGVLFYVNKNSDPGFAKALAKKGYARLEGPYFKSYFETFDTAVNALGDAMRQPGDPIKNVANAAEQLKERLTAAKEMLSNPVQEVWAPKHAVAWMNMRLNPGASDHQLGRLIRWGLNAGGLLPYYKGIATVLNPRYWIANAVGDAALALLYGLHPSALKYAHRLREFVPDEIADIPINKLYQSQYNGFTRTLNKYQHYASAIDNFFKRATYIDAQVKEGIRKGLLKVGADFFAAEEQLKPYLAQIMTSPNEWVDTLANITRGKEKAAMLVRRRAELDDDLEKAATKLTRAAAREGPPGAVAADDVYGGGKPVDATTYGFDGNNQYRFSPKEAAAQEKAIAKLTDEIDTLKAIQEGRETALPYDVRDVLPKSEVDMIEALAFAPDRASKWIDKRIAERVKEIESLRANPAEIFKRRQELPAGEAASWEASGFTGPEKVVGPYDIGGAAKPPTRAQAVIAGRQKQYDELASKIDQKATDELAALHEVGRLEKLIPGVEARARSAEKAIDIANKFYGSYSRLTPWEKKIAREFIPFYTFTKAMTQLAFRWPFMMPRRQFVYLNLWRAWQDVMEDNYPRSSWAKNLTPVFALENGDVIAIRDGSFSPMAGVRMTGVGGFEIPSVFDIFGQNPVVRLVMSARGQLTPKPLTPGSKATRLDNGEVWEWTGRGWKRVVLQPSALKQLWSLFPQSQIFDALALSAVQEEAGFALRPQPLVGPQGEPLYPIGWQERLLSAVLPTTRINPEELEKRELGKITQILRSYQDDLRRANPARRAQILQIFQAMQESVHNRYQLLY